MRVYLDLVMGMNFAGDLLLLLGTNRLAGFASEGRRVAGAAALGSVYSGVCLLDSFRFLGSFLWRIVTLAGMAGIAFGWNRSAIQRGAVFILLSMALGGFAMGMGRNSFPMLILAAALMWGLCKLSFQGGVGQREYIPVELTWKGKIIKLLALRDTGNTLRDPITGEQVLVAGADVAMELLGISSYQLRHPVEAMAKGEISGLRLIPYHTVGQPAGLLPAFRFHGAKIGNTYMDPLVAFAPEVLARGEGYRMLTGGAI